MRKGTRKDKTNYTPKIISENEIGNRWKKRGNGIRSRVEKEERKREAGKG